jgi:hypothetical protein
MTPSEKLDRAVREMFAQLDYLVDKNEQQAEQIKYLHRELKDMEYQRDRARDIAALMYKR